MPATAKPILFNAEMVRALLAGRKTQTRRAIKNPTFYGCLTGDCPHYHVRDCKKALKIQSPYNADYLWVRETWGRYNIDQFRFDLAYRATDNDFPSDGKWRPSIHMPIEFSRITLEITDIRAERLQSMSENDALAEGVEKTYFGKSIEPYRNYNFKVDSAGPHFYTAKESYCSLWDSIYRKTYPWSDNPWVWVIEYKVHLCRLSELHGR